LTHGLNICPPHLKKMSLHYLVTAKCTTHSSDQSYIIFSKNWDSFENNQLQHYTLFINLDVMQTLSRELLKVTIVYFSAIDTPFQFLCRSLITTML